MWFRIGSGEKIVERTFGVHQMQVISSVKVKVKVTLEQATKAQKGVEV
jgi:hypothetical protein